ncbi:MAG TPA: type II toxin-antitoxin system VapC family toxin [Reyranella sp.]|nr:type II toxin-antitoxin system VapC family toxin [Reyranella sp.]
MILADTSIWIDHLNRNDAELARRLEAGLILAHPFVIGELALSNLRQLALILGALRDLPQAMVASDDEVLSFIERQDFNGRGIGYVDAHLLASIRLTPDARLWTRDKRLLNVAAALDRGA